MPTVHCIECDEEIELEGRTRIGQKLTCDHCGAELEIISLNPLDVDYAADDAAADDLDDEWEDEFDSLDEDEFDELDDDEYDDELDSLDEEEDDFDDEGDDDDDRQWV